MCQRLIEYHKDESRMTVAEVGTTVTVVAALLGVFAWFKNRIDGTKKDHAALAETLAKDYMDKDETLKMYALISQPSEVKIEMLAEALRDLKDSNSDHFERIYSKLEKLAER